MTRPRNLQRATGADDMLTVRCAGRRLAVVYGPGPDPLAVEVAVRRSTWLYLRGNLLSTGSERAPSREWPPEPIECPNHPRGHLLSGARLREVIALRCTGGRRASVDIARVEAPAAASGGESRGRVRRGPARRARAPVG